MYLLKFAIDRYILLLLISAVSRGEEGGLYPTTNSSVVANFHLLEAAFLLLWKKNFIECLGLH